MNKYNKIEKKTFTLCNFVTMKRIIITLAAIMTAHIALCQSAAEGREECTFSQIKMWQAQGPLGYAIPSTADTLLEDYHINDLAFRRSIAVQTLGNRGSASISKIFSDRNSRSNFLFFQPYSLYYTAPEDVNYFNTKRPYANISYYNGGPSNRKQESVDGIFTINATPHLNFGMYGKWQNNYGAFENQSTKNYNAGFFGSYMHRHHNLMANFSLNGYRAKENGGLTNTEYITDPKNAGELDAYNMPVYFSGDVNNKLVNWNAYLNYKYNFGFDKTIEVTSDSSTTTFIPVSSLIYTFRTETDYNRYLEGFTFPGSEMEGDTLYKKLGLGQEKALNNASCRDSVHYWEMTHTAGLSLNEEFNTLGKFGLVGYFTYTQKEYGLIQGIQRWSDHPELAKQEKVVINEFGSDSIGRLGRYDWGNVTKTRMGIGAQLSKHSGEHLLFNFEGEYYFKDEKETASTYKLGGDVSSRFNIGRNIFLVKARASQNRECPDYLEEHYFGNRFQWNNNFDNKTRTEIEGTIGAQQLCLYNPNDSNFLSKIAPEIGLLVKANETTIANHIYWGTDAQPHQYGKTLSVTQLSLQEKLKIWYLHFDNELTFQYTNTEADVLDLPSLCWYSNIYLRTKKLFKVMTLQLGADMRYNTAYYAPAYMPATGAFYAQTAEKLGEYPYWDLYLSMHLKTFRVFVEYNHFNNLWSSNHDYLVTPGYALDQDYIKFGVSVNFDN